ncbi:MAG TPA: hypothetical protein VKB26_03165 [Candidatus Acidoferrales bacterium]|nr:hypothetical protein [Candidatus Acidoferrales bacterium]
MDVAQLVTILSFYFPDALNEHDGLQHKGAGQKILQRLAAIPTQPLSRTHFNQLLHLNHEAGVSPGFFQYYLLEKPETHPYPIEALFPESVEIYTSGVVSIEQLKLGLHRFFIDSLLFFGNFRTAYRHLRGLSYEEIRSYFSSKRFETDAMGKRGPTLPFSDIPADDRYLIAEMACKAYTPRKGASETLLEAELLKAYQACGQSKVPVKTLIKLAEDANQADLQAQLSFGFSCEEFMDAIVESDDQLRTRIREVAERFNLAREKALSNTNNYLSIVNELDVYVATSMRNRQDFREMSKNCSSIFKEEKLRPLQLRYFDPTNSAATSHEDKGLLECLMVKCSKVLIYFAGEKESFGKDVEAAMALSLGKPVIIYCPSTLEGEKKARFFRDIHPLSRLINVSTGVAVGAMITNRLEHVVELLYRIFSNDMEYDVEHDGDGYFRLVERMTRSVVRLHTNSKVLRESFWNYYHQVN